MLTNDLLAVRVSLIGLVFMAGIHSSVLADEPASKSTEALAAHLNEFVQYAENAFGFSGAVLAARDGEIVTEIAVGSLHDAADTPLTTNTLFEIASATKPMAAMTALRLQQSGQLDLDDSISKHLPGVPDNCSAITVRHLINHTSGIPGTNLRGRGEQIEPVVKSFLMGGPKHPPGTHFEYWNQGYSLLSGVIAVASGKDFLQCTQQDFFSPAKMKSSCFTGQDPPKGFPIAIGKSIRGPSRSAMEPPYGPTYGYEYRAMGGMVTNVQDLFRLDRAIASGELLNKESMDQMLRVGQSDYALGWRIAKDDLGRAYHHHTGGVRGFQAHVMRFPSIDGCLFVLSNFDNGGCFHVSNGCRALLLGEKESLDLPRPIDPASLKAMLGTFVNSKGQSLVLTQRGPLLAGVFDWGGIKSSVIVGLNKSDDLTAFSSGERIPIETIGESGEVDAYRILGKTFSRKP